MVTTLDVKRGQIYGLMLKGREEPIVAEFVKEMLDGRFKFAREGTDLDLFIAPSVFEVMRSSGAAKRLTVNALREILPDYDPDPCSLLDPDEPSITLREQKKRLVAIEQLIRSRTLRYYVRKYDAFGDVGRGHKGVGSFVSKLYLDALAQGFSWRPGPATILRAVDTCGTPGNRPLSAFFDQRGKHNRLDRWPLYVTEAAEAMIQYYWGDRRVRIGEAIDRFTLAMTVERGLREARGRPVTEDDPFEQPHKETLRLWIRAQMDWYHWASKYGKKQADRRFRGRGRMIEATRPLEYVMIDHTIIDAWAVVLDEDGEPVLAERPCLTVGIDCYSRMVLAAVLTFERPSIYAATACIRQIVRRKTWLIEQYGTHFGATDGWGRPFTVIVDNGWEFTGSSFQTSCEAAGIDVIWVPVKVPMFKAYVERLFGTLNTMVWHDIEGGIPLTPQQRKALEMDPQAEAAFTRSQLETILWNVIVTVYHMKEHSTLEMAPAEKWRRGLQKWGRPTVDDVTKLDKVVGKVDNVLLTAEGVEFDTVRYHDPEITSSLMNRFAYQGKERTQRKGTSSSRTVKVLATADPGDASRIFVWDNVRRESIELPSWVPELTQGLSMRAVKKIRAFATQRNLAFQTPVQMAAARIAHKEFMREILAGKSFAEARKVARLVEPIPDLMPGSQIHFASDEVGDGLDITHDVAAWRTDTVREAEKSHRRGGKAATKKAAASRARNRAQARTQTEKSTTGRDESFDASTPTTNFVNHQMPAVDTTAIEDEALHKVQARLARRGNL